MQKAAIAFLTLGAFCMVFPIVPKEDIDKDMQSDLWHNLPRKEKTK